MKRKMLLTALFLCTVILVQVQAKEIFSTSFSGQDGKIHGKGIKEIATPFGKGMFFPGEIGNFISFTPPAGESNQAFSVSIWFKVDTLPSKTSPKNKRAYTLFCRNWDVRLILSSTGKLDTQVTVGKDYFTLSGGKVMPGEWNNIVYTYSVPKKEYALYVNGNLVNSRKMTYKKVHPQPYSTKQPCSFGSLPGFWPMKGIMGKGVIYDNALTAKEILSAEKENIRKVLLSLKKRAEKEKNNTALLKKIGSALQQKEFPAGIWITLSRECAELEAKNRLAANGVIHNEFLYYAVVDPMGRTTYLPDSSLPENSINEKIRTVAAKDEFEPASFVVSPLKDVKNFLPVMGELKTKDGKVFPAPDIDIRLVKVLVQSGGGAVNRHIRVLKAVALLHDDALVKVDTEKMENYLRLSFPGKTEYQWISKQDASNRFHIYMSSKANPIYDAKTLQKLDLKKDKKQQYWITFRTRKDTAPGLYEGNLYLTARGKNIQTIPVKFRVLDFTLPAPKTNYDPSKTYYTGIYYWAHDSASLKEGSITSRGRNMEQTRADLKNMYEHGIRYPSLVQELSVPEKWQWNAYGKPEKGGKVFAPDQHSVDATRRRLALLKENCMKLDPFFIHTGGNFGYREFYKRREHEKDLKRFIEKSNDFFVKELGHKNILHYGLDEASGNALTNQFEIWKDIQKLGTNTFTTASIGSIPLIAGKIKLLIASGVPAKKYSDLCHSKGTLIWNYANPQAGTKDQPFPYRANFGFGCYSANYDGIATYSYNTTALHPWNDFDNRIEPDLAFVLHTADGMVDTPSWEGYREGIDDVRYATMLRQLILQYKTHPQKGKTALLADKFLNLINVHDPEFDPSWTRLQIIEFILKLTKENK